MRLIFALHCICLIATFTEAGIPLPKLGDSQAHLTENCRTPRCPEVKTAEDLKKVVLLPYPLDCLQYVECKGHEAQILPCPPDQVFDKDTFSCGPQDKVRCVPCYQQLP